MSAKFRKIIIFFNEIIRIIFEEAYYRLQFPIVLCGPFKSSFSGVLY